ncbi:hypothetical protein O181_061774 [Austropuccinia psidii MF-1]|uniref:Uncharacterized protein n=1 Tax=Austropuccinia psidii MF-1 TaxID=1389203 RepID=A0A9Q3EIV4_9BASI|nr:hypothetical protein [Austropuccinia psidii MF-1]
MASRAQGLYNALCRPQPTVHGTLRTLEGKRGQGRSPPAPKARWVSTHKWAHLSQFGPQAQQSQKWPKGPQDPDWTRTKFWPLSTTRGHQLRSSKASPQFRG